MQHKSILDSHCEAGHAKTDWAGRSSQSDEFTTSVRDVERRIQMAEAQKDGTARHGAASGRSSGIRRSSGADVRLESVTFRSDLTRVITFMLAKEQSARPYPQIACRSVSPLSHHNDIPEIVERMSKINTIT
jgi:hypothetical protein